MTKSCNICHGKKFGDMRPRREPVFVRKGVRCESCGSLERHRLIYEFLNGSGLLERPKDVLHVAPERCLAKVFASRFGNRYLPADKDVERYKSMKATALDLCTDLHKFDGRGFDIVLHNHVLEHLPCNYAIILRRLHSLVRPGGAHTFLPFPSWKEAIGSPSNH